MSPGQPLFTQLTPQIRGPYRRGAAERRPGVFEVHALLALEGQVTLVGLEQLVGGDTEEAAVYVHVFRHDSFPPIVVRCAIVDATRQPLYPLISCANVRP